VGFVISNRSAQSRGKERVYLLSEGRGKGTPREKKDSLSERNNEVGVISRHLWVLFVCKKDVTGESLISLKRHEA